MNIIQQYELKYITFDQLSEEIWGYGQRLINEVGVERFSFYVEAAAGYHNFRFYIFPLYKVFYGFYRVISMNPFLFLQIGVDTRIMRVLNYYCKRNNKRK